MLRQTLAVGLLSTSALAAAQVPSAFLGTWTVTWQGEKRPQQAKLVITESGGTWRTTASSKIDGCSGKEAPIALEQLRGEEATFRLKFSEALQGCTDARIKVKKLSDKALSGTRGRTELTIERD